VPLPPPRAQAVLAVLLVHANRVIGADQLCEELWPAGPPSSGRSALQVHVAALRRVLGPAAALTTRQPGYVLELEADELDACRFERAARQARAALAAGDAEQARAELELALGLWRGAPLADLSDVPCVRSEAARLEEERLAAFEDRIEADLRLGRHGELAGELAQLTSEHPYRERLHAQRMLALYRAGRQADALAAYRQARSALVDELGIEPGAPLRELERAILAQDPNLLGDAAQPTRPPIGPAAAPAVRVPLPPTSTVGREGELARLTTVVGDTTARLVTIVGPGGVGKTRLAVELAHGTGAKRRGGAQFVSLAGLNRDEQVASTIARELGIALLRDEAAEDALTRHLRPRELLLVLDNFEHVLGAARLVADLLAAAAELTVLATSREPLRVRGERLFHLDPLGLPSATDRDASAARASPAVALFIALARARGVELDLTEHTAADVVDICRRLDGLPLAIELAAGRLELLSVSELAERLRRDLWAVGTGPRDSPARHRTLRATLRWSHALLTHEEQRAFTAFGTFAGDCTLETAEAVTGARLEVLEALAAKNLLFRHAAPDGRARLGMLETVREFARAELARDQDARLVHERHARHYATLAERARPPLERSTPIPLLAELDRELNNFRAALRWSLDQGTPELALRIASALSVYWSARNLHREAASWLGSALDLAGPATAPAVRAQALQAYAYSLIWARTNKKAEAAARESLELRRALHDQPGYAASACALATVLMQAHRVDDAYRCASEAEQLAREADHETARMHALSIMAMMAPTLEASLALGEQAAAAYRAVGNDRHLAQLRSDLSYSALYHGDYTVAQRLSAEALEAASRLDAPELIAYAHGNAALAALHRGDAERARDGFLHELQFVARQPIPQLVHEPLSGLAALAAVQGLDELAAMLSGAADTATLDRHDPVIARRLDERFFAPARARLGEHAWNAAYTRGAALDTDHAINIALRIAHPPAVA